MRTLCLILVLNSACAWGAVYRWVDAQGHAHYGDQATAPGAKPVALPPLQFISAQPPATTGARDSRPAGDAVSRAPALAIDVVSPRSDEVLRNTDRSLAIGVALKQPLPDGGGLIFRVDGNPANRSPSRNLQYTATEIERGTHLIDVSVVDAGGREIGRSAPVLVHLKPPGLH